MENILPENLKDFHIHFVGIKGTGMAALVEICHARNAVISGSDVPEVFYTDTILKNCGITPYTSFDASHITDDIQLVVYSSAYKPDENPELIEAKKRGIKTVLYSQALGEVSKLSYSCGICGVHGKTTTTGLTGTILKALDLPVQVLAGSMIPTFSENPDGSCTFNNGEKFFIAETCEYQRHFMSFHPKKIILTSVESDHQDFYPTFKDIQNAFVDYICLLPEHGELIYCADDTGAAETACLAALKRPDIKLTPYGESARNPDGSVTPFTLMFGNIKDGRQYFSLAGFDTWFSLSVFGKHMVRNANAAITLSLSLLACNLGFDSYEKIPEYILSTALTKIQNALSLFKGAKRRSEIIDRVIINNNDVIFIDDYGHHPTAINTTLSGLKDFYPDRIIICDFMSHTYTRTKALLDEFASCFSCADKVILHKIYGSAREKIGNVLENGKTIDQALFEKISQHHKDVKYFSEILDGTDYALSELSKTLPSDKTGYLFVTMGAGDNWKITKEILKRIK